MAAVLQAPVTPPRVNKDRKTGPLIPGPFSKGMDVLDKADKRLNKQASDAAKRGREGRTTRTTYQIRYISLSGRAYTPEEKQGGKQLIDAFVKKGGKISFNTIAAGKKIPLPGGGKLWANFADAQAGWLKREGLAKLAHQRAH